MHAQPPLQRDRRALGWLEESDQHDRGQHHRNADHRRHRKLAGADGDEGRGQDVPSEEDRDIGRKIVRPVLRPVLMARRASGHRLQEAGEQLGLAAARAFPLYPAPCGGGQRCGQVGTGQGG